MTKTIHVQMTSTAVVDGGLAQGCRVLVVAGNAEEPLFWHCIRAMSVDLGIVEPKFDSKYLSEEISKLNHPYRVFWTAWEFTEIFKSDPKTYSKFLNDLERNSGDNLHVHCRIKLSEYLTYCANEPNIFDDWGPEFPRLFHPDTDRFWPSCISGSDKVLKSFVNDHKSDFKKFSLVKRLTANDQDAGFGDRSCYCEFDSKTFVQDCPDNLRLEILKHGRLANYWEAIPVDYQEFVKHEIIIYYDLPNNRGENRGNYDQSAMRTVLEGCGLIRRNRGSTVSFSPLFDAYMAFMISGEIKANPIIPTEQFLTIPTNPDLSSSVLEKFISPLVVLVMGIIAYVLGVIINFVAAISLGIFAMILVSDYYYRKTDSSEVREKLEDNLKSIFVFEVIYNPVLDWIKRSKDKNKD